MRTCPDMSRTWRGRGDRTGNRKVQWRFSLRFMVLFAFLAATQANADDADRPLTVCWAHAPPYYQIGADGAYSGFFIELSRRVAAEIGLATEIHPRETLADCAEAQSLGEVDFIVGAGQFEFFAENNVFSVPLGRTRHQAFALGSRVGEIDLERATGLHIILWRQDISPLVQALADRNIVHEVTASGAAMFALLSGDVDVIVFPEDAIQARAYEAGVDHRIRPIGPPLAEFDRVAVLNKSRAELIAPINEAIRRLEADGTLLALRHRFKVDLFDPPPEILTVALPELPADQSLAPYYFLDEKGEMDGFVIDLFTDLAQLAGITWEYRFVPLTSLPLGPAAAGVDIIPLLGISPSKDQQMDFSLPLEHLETAISIRAGEAGEITSLEDLAGRRVGAFAGSYAHGQARAQTAFETVAVESIEGLLRPLLEGDVDAVLATRRFMPGLAERNGVGDQLQELDPTVFRTSRAIALRYGLGEAREAFNSVIPGYLLSDEFETLRQVYFGEPLFWTETRRQIAFAALGIAVIVLLGTAIGLVLSLRGRSLALQQAARIRDVSSRLQAVMDAAQSAILALDRSGRIAIANAQARAMLGLAPETVPVDWPATARFLETQGQAELTETRDPLRRAQAGDALRDEMLLLSAPDGGAPRHVQLASSSLPPDASPEIGTVLVIHDVTEQERSRTKAERSDRLSAIGQLTGGVAHDFNNLLAVIMGNQELLRDHLSEPAELRMADATIAAAQRGADLTQSMLAFARRAPLRPRRVDLNALIEETRSWISRMLPSNITLETRLAQRLWPVEADPGETESVLLNLILNAKDAMPEGGRLIVETANIGPEDAQGPEDLPEGPHVLLSVSDSGEGIAPEHLSRIFDPFFTTKPPGSGSGLGLSKVQGFMKQSGGEVRVLSQPGQGARFQLFFGALETGAEGDGAAQPTRPPERPAGLRVLVAEDDPEVLDLTVRTLRAAGHAVTATGDGASACRAFEADPGYDLLVSDVMMPGGLLGPELARRLQALSPGLRVILVSGYEEEEEEPSAAAAPGPAPIRLMKPVSRDTILAAIRQSFET